VIFLLGTHEARWLAEPRFANVPLFIARQRLARGKTQHESADLARPVLEHWDAAVLRGDQETIAAIDAEIAKNNRGGEFPAIHYTQRGY